MATKIEMIQYIIENTDNKEEELKELTYNKVKKIFDSIEEVEEEIFNEKEEGKKENKVFTIEVPELTDEEAKEFIKNVHEQFKKTINIIEKEETKEIDFFNLSPVQRRAYQRSGIIPKKK